MASAGVKTRAVAAEVIDAVVTGGRSLDAAITAAEQRLPIAERPLMHMLAFGTLRNYFRLQEWVNDLVSRPLQSKDSVINALLAAGLFQLCDTRIPDHAAVSLTVEAARALRRPGLAGLLNACLRRFRREGLASQEARSEEARFNHPQWFIDRVRRDWPDDWEAILDANNERLIMKNLDEFFKGKTVVIVAHRLSTVKKADQIVVLDLGKIIERGTHAELTKLRGEYYNLVKNQLELGK